jgi:hypothetical protein
MLITGTIPAMVNIERQAPPKRHSLTLLRNGPDTTARAVCMLIAGTLHALQNGATSAA